MYWINGQRHDALAPSDRGLQFGDGCFTTARVIDGKIELLPWHLERLQQAAQRLMLPATDWLAFEREMALAAESIPLGVVKAILTRGSGGRGYSRRCENPTRIVARSSPCALFAVARAGITLALSPVALARNPLLAGLKHLNRLEQVLIRAHLDQTAADEAVLTLPVCWWNAVRLICSGVRKRGIYPDLSQAGVAGLMRRRVIALLAGSEYRLHCVVNRWRRWPMPTKCW